VSLSLVVYAVRLSRTGTVSPTALILFPVVSGVAALVFIVLARRELAQNAFNRRLAGWFLALVLTLVGNRVIGQSIGVSVAHQFAFDSVLLAAMLVVGGLFLYRWLWICAGLMVASAVIAAAAPGGAHIAFELAEAMALLISAFLVPRRRS
jgi:hypothetical protein